MLSESDRRKAKPFRSDSFLPILLVKPDLLTSRINRYQLTIKVKGLTIGPSKGLPKVSPWITPPSKWDAVQVISPLFKSLWLGINLDISTAGPKLAGLRGRNPCWVPQLQNTHCCSTVSAVSSAQQIPLDSISSAY